MISDAQPPMIKLKIVLSGEAKKKKSGYVGTYTLQSTPVNGNPWWKKGVFEKEAIWFVEKNGNWMIGNIEDLGKGTGGLSGPFGVDEWPNDITSGWQYASNGWHEAGNDILFEGKQNHSNLLNLTDPSSLDQPKGEKGSKQKSI